MSGEGRRARTAALAAVAAAATVSGCLLFDNNQKCSGGPAADVSWTITNAAGEPQSCGAAGASSVNVYFGGMKQSFSCFDTAARTQKLPAAGSYSMRADLVGNNGVVIAQVPATEVMVDSCDVTTVEPFPFVLPATCASRPSFQLSWDLIDTMSNPLDCDTAGAALVVVTVGQDSFPFPCNQYAGLTDPLDPGTYDVSVELLDANGQAIATTPTMPVELPCGGPVARPVEFVLGG
jgi:hypothetical protein